MCVFRQSRVEDEDEQMVLSGLRIQYELLILTGYESPVWVDGVVCESLMWADGFVGFRESEIRAHSFVWSREN